MNVETITYLTLGLIILALVLFFAKNDEFLLLVVLFFYSSGINRYNMVLSGREKWVVVAYSKNIFNLTNELGLEALNYFFWGTFTFSVAYFFFKSNYNPPVKKLDMQPFIAKFLDQNKTLILISFLVVAIVHFYSKRGFIEAFTSGGASIAMGNSYFIMIGFAFGGFIVLVYLIYSNLDLKKAGASKLFYLAIFAYAGFNTYSSTGRFQFLSWGVAVGIMLVKDAHPIWKLRTYLIGGYLLAVAFGLAGALRGKNAGQLTWSEKMDLAMARNSSGEDQTMLDGFMMVLQVYPKHLNYHFGSEHLEVLMRPIPRSWWPNKPLGGYANKLGLNDNMGGGSVGISQSMYGSFYGEGGFLGIIIFSIIYAFVFHRIFAFGDRFGSDLRWMIKGIAISSAIPLLRGGDLPGIYAFIGMTFWPTFVFIYRYRKYSRKMFLAVFAYEAQKKFQFEQEMLAKINSDKTSVPESA